jgi:hypothetical protein
VDRHRRSGLSRQGAETGLRSGFRSRRFYCCSFPSSSEWRAPPALLLSRESGSEASEQRRYCLSSKAAEGSLGRLSRLRSPGSGSGNQEGAARRSSARGRRAGSSFRSFVRSLTSDAHSRRAGTDSPRILTPSATIERRAGRVVVRRGDWTPRSLAHAAAAEVDVVLVARHLPEQPGPHALGLSLERLAAAPIGNSQRARKAFRCALHLRRGRRVVR